MMKSTTATSIFPTLLGAIAVTVALTQPHAGFLIVIPLIIFPFWLIANILKSMATPTTRSRLLVRSLLWIGAIAIVIAVHYQRAETIRNNADEIVATITSYTTANGHCPDMLDEVGLSETALQQKVGASGYMCALGKPTFLYVAPFIIKDRYVYDFSSAQWRYQASLLRTMNGV